jgi:hypothetical protein
MPSPRSHELGGEEAAQGRLRRRARDRRRPLTLCLRRSARRRQGRDGARPGVAPAPAFGGPLERQSLTSRW